MDSDDQNFSDLGRKSRLSSGMATIFFVFGLAAGFLAAFSGVGIVADSAKTILTLGIVAIGLVAVLGLSAFLLRGPILSRIFGFADTEIERFADPLSRVAQGAVDRDPHVATSAAQDLARFALARYSWVSTRRWVIASLTGLIAAMAAFAGTALLFEQNSLLERQSVLLEEQNEKLKEQTKLLGQDVQLAEAARNAELAVEITNIAGLLGEALNAAIARDAEFLASSDAQPIDPYSAKIAVLDPLNDLNQSLLFRIVAASRATRPYRFLQLGLDPESQTDRNREAMVRRRHDLPAAYETMFEAFGWQEPPDENTLVDRPASPERGQMLWSLLQSGIRDYELLNFLGLDLSFAHAPGINLFLCSFQGARLSYANLTSSEVNGTSFGGAILDNARFDAARIVNSSFQTVAADAIKPPYQSGDFPMPTLLNGTSFVNSIILETSFGGVQGLAINFDGALLVDADFTDASMPGATFLGSVLINPVLEGANFSSVDLDGAIVFGEDFLNELDRVALAGTFRLDRYKQVPIELIEILETPSALKQLSVADIQNLTDAAPAFRIVRIAPFEQPELNATD